MQRSLHAHKFHPCQVVAAMLILGATVVASACGAAAPGTHATATPKPVSTGQLIYFSPQSASGTQTSSTLYAIDAGSGVQAWNAAMGGIIDTIIVTDGVILAATVDPNTATSTTTTAHLFGLDATNGHQLWHKDLTNSYYRSLCIAGGLVIGTLNADRSAPFQTALVAFKPADGSQVWQSTFDQGIYVDPVANTNGTAIAFVPEINSSMELLELDSNTGKTLWQQSQTVGNPAFAGSTLYVGTSGTQSGGVSSPYTGQQIVALNAATGQQIWQKTQDGFALAAANSTGALAYVQNSSGNHLIALKASDGSQVWQAPFPVLPGNLEASDTTVYGVTLPPTAPGATPTISETGIFALNAGTGAQIWNSPLDQQAAGQIAIGDGALFTDLLGEKGSEIEALRPGDGSILWKYPVSSNPTIVAVGPVIG